MKLAIAVFVVMFSVNSYAYEFAEKWNWTDTAYQGVFFVMWGGDYLQTRTQAKNNWYIGDHQYRESCPLLPEHPDTKQVDIYFAACAIGHTLVALALPPNAKVFDFDVNPRRIWQMVWIGIETGYVVNNYSVGVRIEF